MSSSFGTLQGSACSHERAHSLDGVRLSPRRRSFDSSSSDDCPVCWICLDMGGELVYPCRCPRMAHKACLARWQLQSAGTRKETHCEFCDSVLPDWKDALSGPKHNDGLSAPAVMNVNFDGKTYSFEVEPGPDGYRKFTESIRMAFELPEDSELNITFTCDEPTLPEVGSLLTLQGPGAYDAAVHCASLSAARRLSNQGPNTPLRTTSLPVEYERTPHSSEREERMQRLHPSLVQSSSEEAQSMIHDGQSLFRGQEAQGVEIGNGGQTGQALHGPRTPAIPRYGSLPGIHDEVMREAHERPAEAAIRGHAGSSPTKRRLSGRISRRITSLFESFVR